MRYLIIASLTTILYGCNSTSNESQTYKDLTLTQDEATLSSFETINKFPARYPINEASAGVQGCATLEYVVTQELKVVDIKTIDATNKNFAKEAKRVITRWNWTSLNKDLLTSPVKTQTRFEFCIEDGKGSCSMQTLSAKTQCSGSDVVASVGSFVK